MDLGNKILTGLLKAGKAQIAAKALDILEEKGEKALEEFVDKKLGLDKSNIETSIKERAGALNDIEHDLAIELEENRHDESMMKMANEERELLLKEQELDNEDRKGARELGGTMMASGDKVLSRFVPAFAVFIVVLAFSLMGGVLWFPVEKGSESIEIGILEFTKNIVIMLASYFYGSSHQPTHSTNKE